MPVAVCGARELQHIHVGQGGMHLFTVNWETEIEDTIYLDVEIPVFEPRGFEFCWELRRRAGNIGGESGIMPEELKTLCTQCVKCKNFVSRSTHLFHECPDVTAVNE